MNRIVSIILVLALGIVFMAMPFASFASYDPESVIDDVTVQVFQQNTSYAGWSNQSAIIKGSYCLGTLRSPQSLAFISSNASVLAGSTLRPSKVQITVSYPTLGKSQVIYFSVFNTFSAFNSSIQLETYMEWSDAYKGYTNKTGFTSSLGYYAPISATLNTFAVPSASNRVAYYESQISGSAGGSSSYTGNISYLGAAPANVITPQLSTSGGSVYDDFAWMHNSGTNDMYIYRYDVSRPVDASNMPASTMVFTLDDTALNSCKVISGASSSRFVHSAVFVPMVICYDSTGWSQDILDAVDNVITQLASVGSTIHTDLSSIISAIGSGNITVISGISSMLTQLQQINSKLSSVTGNRYSSAIQYIEYYLNQVLSNTNTMVQQLNDITSTLSSIANTIQATNEQAEELTGSSEEVHAQEQVLFEQANSSIGSTVIGSFAFDLDTSAGMGRVGIDFTNLWNALGNWHNVYIFAMTLTLAFTIIRFTSARSRAKNKSNKANEGG